MKIYAEKLLNAVKESQDEEDFPDYLAVQVHHIAENIDEYSEVKEMLSQLALMILDYNTYAETCCEKIGTSHFDIDNMLSKIRETAGKI